MEMDPGSVTEVCICVLREAVIVYSRNSTTVLSIDTFQLGEMHELVPELLPSTPLAFLPLSAFYSLLPSFLNPSLSSFLPFPLVPLHPLPSLSSSSLLWLPLLLASFLLIPIPSSIPPRRLRQAPTCVTRGVWVGAVHSPGC